MTVWPTCGQSGYITPAVLGVINDQRREENHKWLCGPHVGKVATSPLPSWGSPTPSAGTTISNGTVAHIGANRLHHRCGLWGPKGSSRRQKSKIATWSTCGQSGYVTLAVLGVSNAQRGDKTQKWLCGSHGDKVATPPLQSRGSPTPSAGTSPILSWGSPTLSARTNIRDGGVAHVWAKWLHHPCRLGGPQRLARGQKLEMATWLTCRQSGYLTRAVLGVLNGK